MERIEDNFIYVFDACNLINIYNIDEDDFLLKILFKLNFKIPGKVFNELQSNIYKKYQFYKINNHSYDKEKLDGVEKYLSSLRGKIVSDKEIKVDLKELYNKMQSFCFLPGSKESGEELSTALSLILSRDKEQRVIFFTDDYSFSMRSTSSDYFIYNQIGYISDTSELLTYLYWRFSNFRKSTFIEYLTSLKSEYNLSVEFLLDKLRNYKSNMPPQIIRSNKDFVESLVSIIRSLDSRNFIEFNKKFDYFKRKKSKYYKDIASILKSFENIKELSSNNSNNQITKINNLIEHIDKYEIFKIA